MSFKDQTSAFFDEISSMLDEQKKSQEADMDAGNERPYSSQLTQDEEPTTDYNAQQAEEAEPEVYTRAQQ